VSRILVATDGSEFADHATREAVRLFGSTNQEYIVLAVAPGALASGAVAITPTAEVALAPEAWEQIEEASKAAAHEFAERAAEIIGGDPRQVVVPGDPADTICRAADDLHADVVVIGSRGSGLLTRMLTGSVSTHVVHHSPCPVLVVREGPDDHSTHSAE
jgi:nucleotide-binding universal stress UspA family protein